MAHCTIRALTDLAPDHFRENTATLCFDLVEAHEFFLAQFGFAGRNSHALRYLHNP